jgi:adenylate cyclase
VALEIERKFLVRVSPVTAENSGTSIVQGHLPIPGSSMLLRVRVTPEAAYLAVKSQRQGSVRTEFESEIGLEIGDVLLGILPNKAVAKMRYPILESDRVWVVDVFQDENRGLILAEVQLSHPDEELSVPAWCGKEVTEDDRYYSAYLAEHPYQSWGQTPIRNPSDRPDQHP